MPGKQGHCLRHTLRLPRGQKVASAEKIIPAALMRLNVRGELLMGNGHHMVGAPRIRA